MGRTDAEAEVPILWPPDRKNWLTGKDPDAGKDWRQAEKGTTEDEMVGWHYRFNGHEFEQALGVGDGQGSLACYSPWGCSVGHDWATEMNWTEYVAHTACCPLWKTLKETEVGIVSLISLTSFPLVLRDNQSKFLGNGSHPAGEEAAQITFRVSFSMCSLNGLLK